MPLLSGVVKWASAGAPAIMLLGIIVALYIGIKSLRQSENIRQSERKQRLLKEIEEWAKELIRFTKEYEKQEAASDPWTVMQARWNIMRATKHNMGRSALKIDRDLGEKVERAVTAFNTLDKNIDKYVGQKITSNVANDLEACRRSCEEVLQSAGSLKFKEIR